MSVTALLLLCLCGLMGSAAAQYAGPVAPACDHADGVQVYPDSAGCDRYYRCANGTLSQHVCEHGLLFSGAGAVHEHCDYHWNVHCGDRPNELHESRDSACPYSFGIFPAGDGCVDYFAKCVYGRVQPELCQEGLAYDARTHSCNWPDLLHECSVADAEQLVGYSCPEHIPAGSASLRFAPFPRFATGECHRLVTCVNYYPRLTNCGYGKAVDENSLTCVDAELVPGCGYEHAPAAALGPQPGYGTGPEPGYGTGPQPGYGTGPEPGYGTGPEPGYGTGPEPGYGTGPQPSYGTGPEPGYGTGPQPGYGSDAEPGYGPDSQLGYDIFDAPFGF